MTNYHEFTPDPDMVSKPTLAGLTALRDREFVDAVLRAVCYDAVLTP